MFIVIKSGCESESKRNDTTKLQTTSFDNNEIRKSESKKEGESEVISVIEFNVTA
jgi:hypothetical protein